MARDRRRIGRGEAAAPERVERYQREETLRLKRSIYGTLGALKKWARFYEKRYAETRAEVYRELLQRKLRQIAVVEALIKALEVTGWDPFAWAAAAMWQSLVAGDGRIRAPEGVPPKMRRVLQEAIAAALNYNSQFGRKRTGWPAVIDCDGFISSALRETRPSDRAHVYAYITFETPVSSRDRRGRVKHTDTITVYMGTLRLGDLDYRQLRAEAYRIAAEAARRHGAVVEEVCIALKPAF